MGNEGVLAAAILHLREIRDELEPVRAQLEGVCDLAAREVAIGMDSIEESIMEIEEQLGIDA